jgi:hypothetical protein
MYTISYESGTAPASLLVVQGVGRALNPTTRSGKPQETNLSAHTYDNKSARHRGTFVPAFVQNGRLWGDFEGRGLVNNLRTEAFDTPVRVWRKKTGWITVAGGKDGLTITFAPDARVVYAVVLREDGPEVVLDMALDEYLDTYC